MSKVLLCSLRTMKLHLKGLELLKLLKLLDPLPLLKLLNDDLLLLHLELLLLLLLLELRAGEVAKVGMSGTQKGRP